MSFKVVNLRTNQAWPDDEILGEKIYENGEEAAKAAENLMKFKNENYRREYYCRGADTGNPSYNWVCLEEYFKILKDGTLHRNVHIEQEDKWQVRKIYDCKEWRERELSRFTSKHYETVPWAEDEHWVEWIKLPPQCDHFVHCSNRDDSCIAYTKDEKSGESDSHIRLTPNRYFDRYLKDEWRKYIVVWQALWTKMKSNVEFKIGMSAEEIEHVYIKGPPSCVAGNPSRFFGTEIENLPHPARAYAAGDLGIAYTVNKKERITARCVIWPDKKIYGHIFGDDAHILRDYLSAEKFKNGSLHGARLAKIPAHEITKKANTYLMPFIDSHRGGYMMVLDGDSYFIAHDYVFKDKDKEYKYLDVGGGVVILPPKNNP